MPWSARPGWPACLWAWPAAPRGDSGKRVGGKPAEIVAAEPQARTAEQPVQRPRPAQGRRRDEVRPGPVDLRVGLSRGDGGAVPRDADQAAGQRPRYRRRPCTPCWPSSSDRGGGAASSSSTTSPSRPPRSGRCTAVWRDGRTVAVKIQYPGAGPALLSDLAQVAAWPGWPPRVPGIEIGPILAELKSRMAEELDYRLEARSQEKFAKGFDGDPHFLIPHVVKFGERVIVSEWIDGDPLSRIIKEGTEEQRDLASQRYMEFLLGPDRSACSTPTRTRATSGPCRTAGSGSWTSAPSSVFSRPADEMGRFLTLAVDGDAEGTLAGLQETGFVRPGMEVDAERLLEYLEPFIVPLRSDTFRFSRRGWVTCSSTSTTRADPTTRWVCGSTSPRSTS